MSKCSACKATMIEYEHYDGPGESCPNKCSYREQSIGWKRAQIVQLEKEIRILESGGTL